MNESGKGLPMAPGESQRRKDDVVARLSKVTDELNELLRQASELGIEREVSVFPWDESVSTMDFSPNPDWNAWLPVSTVGPKYPYVLVTRPGLVKRNDNQK